MGISEHPSQPKLLVWLGGFVVVFGVTCYRGSQCPRRSTITQPSAASNGSTSGLSVQRDEVGRILQRLCIYRQRLFEL
jgi:hypothetical protein